MCNGTYSCGSATIPRGNSGKSRTSSSATTCSLGRSKRGSARPRPSGENALPIFLPSVDHPRAVAGLAFPPRSEKPLRVTDSDLSSRSPRVCARPADSRRPVALTQPLVAEPPRGPRNVSSRARGITPQAKTGQLRLWGPSPGDSGRFELGVGGAVEVRLLGAPGLVVAAGLPVARRGQLLARDAAIDHEVPADLAGDGGLAVHERVDVAGREVEVADGPGQRIAGAVAVQPGEVQVAGRL